MYAIFNLVSDIHGWCSHCRSLQRINVILHIVTTFVLCSASCTLGKQTPAARPAPLHEKTYWLTPVSGIIFGSLNLNYLTRSSSHENFGFGPCVWRVVVFEQTLDRCLGLFADSYKTPEYSPAWLGIHLLAILGDLSAQPFSGQDLSFPTISFIVIKTIISEYWPGNSSPIF